MKIYITGDTHGMLDIDKLAEFNKKCDKMIVAGDFGIPFSVERTSESKDIWSNRDLMTKHFYDNAPYDTLFIDGNHENFDYLGRQEVTQEYGGKVSKLTDKITHLKRGEIYEFNRKKVWVFGGATSIDRAYRIEGLSWWPQEIPSYAEMEYGIKQLESVGNEVDYIITHTPPEKVINLLKYRSIQCPVARYLDHVLETVKYKKWFCGHMHEDVSIKQYKMRLLFKDVIMLK